MTYDLIGFGEGLIRLTPADHERIPEARHVQVAIGGAELNVAVALAQLGLTTGWASALPQGSLGDLFARRVASAGVDTRLIRRTSEGRMGLFWLEEGSEPRPSQVIYDRKGSAASLMQAADWDWPTLLAGTRILHCTGITSALGRGPAVANRVALQTARELGLIASFDINYRSRLWSPAEARSELSSLLPLCHILFSGPGDIETIFGWQGDAETLATRMRNEFGIPLVVLSLRTGANHRRSLALTDTCEYSDEIAFEPIDPLGAGDAFVAGFLDGYLNGDIARALAQGDLMAAIKQTMPGDFLTTSRAEVDELLHRPGGRVRR